VILVDSSVWVDYFRGSATPQTDTLDALLGTEPLFIGDLILTEVLQGFAADADFARARKLLTSLAIVNLGGVAIAVKAARNFRRLRALGVSARKTIDTIIATYCIEHRLVLLHSDRDFEPFVAHLGLKTIA
jgi:predicted nucleic acid-binding protein